MAVSVDSRIASARDGGPATRGLRGSALLLNPRREAAAAAAAAGGGGARSAAPRPGRSRGLQRSRAEPEPSPDALRPPAGSREPRPAGASEVAARGAPRAGKRGGRGTRPGRRCRPAAGDGSRDRGLRDPAAQAGRPGGSGSARTPPSGHPVPGPAPSPLGGRTLPTPRTARRDHRRARGCPSHGGSRGDPQKSGRVVRPEGPGVRPPSRLSALQTVWDF